jgi:mRNA interferase YafQ
LLAGLALLIQEQPLPQTCREHPLKGSWKGPCGAHIEPDWILVYRIEGNDLHLTRTGTHAGIFSL